MKLNQVIAIEKGTKSRVTSDVTELHKIAQKSDLFNGFVKVYQKIAEDGEDLPGERKKVQFTVGDVLAKAATRWTELWDVTSQKDYSNTRASADVVVEGQTIVAAAPVSFLLFLEKQLNDVHTFVSKLPVLDEAEDWTKDVNAGIYKSGEVKTHRTKKMQRALVKYDATPQHPAQTEMIVEDVLAGYWHQIKHSGALPKPQKETLLVRVNALIDAVKRAREEANGAVVDKVPSVGEKVFGFLLGA